MLLPVALALAGVLTGAAPAVAAPPPASSQSNDAVRDVVFALAGPWPDVDPEALEGALEAALSDRGLGVRVIRRVEPGNIFDQIAWARDEQARGPGRATFWVVAGEGEAAELFVIPPGQDLGYVRQLALAADPVERNESLAVVVHAIVDALASGPPADMQTVEASRPDATTDAVEEGTEGSDPAGDGPVEPDVRQVRPGIALHYRGGTLAGEAPWQNGVGGTIDLVLPHGVLLGVAAGWMRGISEAPEVRLTLDRIPVDVMLGWRARRRSKLAVDLQAVFTAERLGWRERGSTLTAGDGSRWRLGLGPQVALVWRAVAGLELQLGAGMRGWVRDADLAVELEGDTATVLAPHRVSADVQAGLGYRF